MLLTIAVCTWNRSALLHSTLSSLVRARIPSGVDVELLVVANACTDDTVARVGAIEFPFPARVVNEPQLGLSNARNRAVAEARGDYILWIDDDVLVDHEWLAAYAAAIAEYPEASFFGGPIRPWFMNTPPAWLQEALPVIGNAFSLLTLGSEPLRFHEHLLPFGANYVIRTDVQRQHPYNPSLGRHGAGLLSGEETAVVEQILVDGGEGWWVPRAGVRHYVSPDRQTLEYIRGYYFHNGVAEGLRGLPDDERRLLGRPAWVWRQAVDSELRYRLTRLTSSPSVWMRHLSRAQVARGMLRGAREREA